MSETMTASPPDAQGHGHTHGLETGPAALPDTAGVTVEGRGWDDMSGLQEAVPPDGKTLHELGENQYTPVEEDLGETAVEGTDVTVPEAVEAEMAAEAADSGLDTTQLPEPEAKPSSSEETSSQWIENPAEAQNASEEPEAKEVVGFDKAKATHEAGENPYAGLSKEELKDMLKELNTFWDEQIKTPYKNGENVDPELWNDFDEKHWLIVYALWDQGLDENKIQDEIDYEAAQARNQANQQATNPSPGLSPNQTTQNPNTSGLPTNPSNTGTSNAGTGAQQPQPQTSPATATQQAPTSSPNQTRRTQQQQTAAAAAQAAAQAAQGGFDQPEASGLATHVDTKNRQTPTTDPEQHLETNSEEKVFVDTLSQEDKEIWQGILRISEQHKDSEVSEALEKLQEDFTQENAGILRSRVEKSAETRLTRGDTFGARQQRILAASLDQLTGHIFGKSINRAA